MGKNSKNKYRLGRVENCCEKLTDLADKWAVQEQKVYDTQEMIRKDLHSHIERFATHDEEEMKKYDKYDGHIREMTDSIKDLSGTVRIYVDEQKSQNRKISKISKLSKATDAKQQKFMFGASIVGTIITIVWVVGTWYFSNVSNKSTEITELQQYQAVQYQALKKAGIIE